MPSNLFADIDAGSAQEAVAILAMAGGVRIERIVSTGQASPTGFWYDQAEAEWVLVVSGSAELLFEGDDHAMRLGPGDYLLIPPHRRHRVEWTDPERPTVWLAVHFPV
ncbi:MAG TPA: cupin domain-containing protein [Rhodospirillaceae bacterium]|nr:cupin domain-containing protein [Rhodospirillaceae bacterium]